MSTSDLEPVRLEFLTSLEIEALQRGGMNMLLLPTGATEQHGAHLPINTDTLIGERLCWSASAITKVPVLPTMSYTVSSGHTTKWPGTFSLSHETFIHAVEEMADWAVKTGWKKLLILNSHFGNNASLLVCIEKIRLKHLGKLQVGLLSSFKLSDSVWEYFSSDVEDLHANKAETDLMLHLAPDLVKMNEAVDDPDRTENCIFSYPVPQTSLHGVTGSPTLGNADDGAKLFSLMLEAFSSNIRKALSEKPPLDPEHWENLCNT